MHILITAGGTREYIDPVRFISNASTGKMGCALAHAAVRRGHKVTLVSAADILPPESAELVKVVSADDMFRAVKDRFISCDCVIMAAAVSDYTPTEVSKSKIKKSPDGMTIHLKPTTDILKWAGDHKTSQIVVGFALDDSDVKASAEEKLNSKNAEMIIANSPDAIGSDKSQLMIKCKDSGWVELPYDSKSASAEKIIEIVEQIRA